MKKIKWGLVGLGRISDLFAKDLLLVEDAEIYAVASRSNNKAKDFARKYKTKKAYGSYNEIFKDPEVDIIYIGTPHNSHAELSIEALMHGKHVLCEKPVALNRQQAESIINASRKCNKFFMEAMWSRFNPSIKEVKRKVADGLIGDVKYINADFAFYVEVFEGSRMTSLELGGGSLLDMGVYPLFLSYLILGIPDSVLAISNFFESGADKQTAIILNYNNAQAVLHSSFVSQSNMIATISGEKGRINLGFPWHEAQSYSVYLDNQKEEIHLPKKGRGYSYEIEECHKCILNYKIESDFWSHKDSLNLISIVDEVRKQTGLRYLME